MKRLMMLCIAFACIVGCGGKDSDPDPGTGGRDEKENAFRERLYGIWSIEKASVEGTVVTSQFPGLDFSISENVYLVANAVTPMWKETGLYELKAIANTEYYTIVRDDDLEMHIVELTSTKLVMEFQWTPSASRASSTAGKYRFEFTKAR